MIENILHQFRNRKVTFPYSFLVSSLVLVNSIKMYLEMSIKWQTVIMILEIRKLNLSPLDIKKIANAFAVNFATGFEKKLSMQIIKKIIVVM